MAEDLQVRETKNLAVMRDDEIIDVCAPWPTGIAVGGAAHFKNTDKVSPEMTDGQCQKSRFDFDFVMDADTGGGLADEDNIANNVDDFLGDFLALSGSNAVDGSIDEDMVVIPDEDLAWLHEPDAFLPLVATASSAEEDAVNSQEAPYCSAGNGEGAGGVPVAAGVSSSMATPQPAEITPAMVAAADSSHAVAEVSLAPVPGVAVVEDGEAGDGGGDNSSGGGGAVISRHEQIRRQKVARYLAKKKRRKWSRASSYQSRQRVANARPRHKGRFLPLESEFVPIAELQRRQRALMIQMEQKMAKREEEEREAVLSRGGGVMYASGRGEGVEGREFGDSVAI